jgi:hypothetical protein
MRQVLLVMGLATAACSASAAAPGPGTNREDSGVSAEASGLAIDGALAPCTDPGPGTSCVLEAKGSVQDLSGKPLAHVLMTFCGAQCYGGQSDNAGAFAIPVGAFLPTEDYAIHADGRPDHAVDYHRLTANEPSIISTTMRLPVLPPSAVQLPPDGAPASSVTVGDLTLIVAAGTVFNLDIEDYMVTRTLRVASVPLASAPSYAADAKVAAIYALAPSGCVPSVKVGIALKNSATLPASSAVEFLVLGDNYGSVPPNVGLLSVQAKGHVSADGQTIQTDPGEGISELTWLAVRKAN